MNTRVSLVIPSVDLYILMQYYKENYRISLLSAISQTVVSVFFYTNPVFEQTCPFSWFPDHCSPYFILHTYKSMTVEESMLFEKMWKLFHLHARWDSFNSAVIRLKDGWKVQFLARAAIFLLGLICRLALDPLSSYPKSTINDVSLR